MSKTPRCVTCGVAMTRIKGRPPLTCSRSVCKKKWMDKHGPLHSRPWRSSAISNQTEFAEMYLESRD